MVDSWYAAPRARPVTGVARQLLARRSSNTWAMGCRPSCINCPLGRWSRSTNHWLETVANVREHGTLKERPLDRFQQEQAELLPLASRPYRSLVLRPPEPKASRSLRPSVPRITVERRPLQVYAQLAGDGR